MPGRRSPLHGWHEKHGAKFIDEFGWEVPSHFAGIQQEYASLRNGCAMIDLCHLSRLRLNGEDRVTVADELLTIDVAGMAPRTTRFAFVCNDRGGVIDGVLVYKDDKYILLTGHPRNKARLLTWLREKAAALQAQRNLQFEIDDVGTAQGQIGALHHQGCGKIEGQDVQQGGGPQQAMCVGLQTARPVRQVFFAGGQAHHWKISSDKGPIGTCRVPHQRGCEVWISEDQ